MTTAPLTVELESSRAGSDDPAASHPYRPYPIALRHLPGPLVFVKDYLVAQATHVSERIGRAPLVSTAWNHALCAASTREIRRAGQVFIHIPKTCGTSISQVLYGRNLPHFTARFYAENAPEDMARLPSFAVVRDPMERAISAWRFVRGGGSEDMAYNRYDRSRLRGLERFDDFVAFLADSDLSTLPSTFWEQSDFVVGEAGEILVDRLFAFSSAKGPSEALRDWVGGRIPHLNASRPYDARFSPESVGALSRLYARDIALYQRLVSAGGAASLRGESIPEA